MSRTLASTIVAIALTWAALRFLVPYEIVRAANVALSLLAAAGLTMRVNDMWKHLSLGRRFTFGGAAFAFVVGAYGSAELYIQQGPGGERIYLWAVTCLVILYGLWTSRHEPRTYP